MSAGGPQPREKVTVLGPGRWRWWREGIDLREMCKVKSSQPGGGLALVRLDLLGCPWCMPFGLA